MTLTEVILVTAMIAIMATAMSSLIMTVQRSYASYEASSGIQLGAQTALNRVQSMLIQSKRQFDSTADPSWLTAAETSGAPTGGPAIMTGSHLPIIEVNGSFAPTTVSTSNTFVELISPNAVGNELFFLSVDTPTNNTVGAAQVLVDSYHFNIYYLAFNPGAIGFGGYNQIVLQEWQSISFADYEELANLGSGALTTGAAAAMYASGYHYAVDTATATAGFGIYSISAGGTLSLMGTPKIPLNQTKPLLNLLTGISGSGYAYGVSPNTTTAFSHSYPVPVFATAGVGTPFPAGFETMIIGANSARQIFVRLVVVASGAFKGYKATGQTVTATVRDLY
jgi:hypothetical protein